MSTSRNIEAPPPGISPGDIYFVIFRHKWKILLLTLLGLAGAAIFYFTKQPLYQSEAKIFIRYVSDNRTLNPADNSSQVHSLIDMGQSVMNSEMEILTSYDLAAKVATNIGPEKILAKVGGGSDAGAAAGVVSGNLKVEGRNDSSVIHVIFRHADPSLVQPILTEIITDYLDKHSLVHKAIGISDETLAEETTQLRLQIQQTDDLLRQAKTNAGIISIADTEKSYQDELTRIKRELFQAKASLEEHQTSEKDLASEEAAAKKNGMTNLYVKVPADQMARYKNICTRLAGLQRHQDEYLQQGFTEDNKLVKEAEDQMADAAKIKEELETRFPSLAEMDTSVAGANAAQPLTEAAEAGQVHILNVRIKALTAQLQQIQGEAAELDEAEAKIEDLQRTKRIQEANYNFFTSAQEQERIDEQLGPGRAPNINVIQYPSPPGKDYSKFYKTLGTLAMSGLLAGLAWAFLIEFFLDRSIKRPVDLQLKLRIPVFLTIPDLNHNRRSRLAATERRQLESGDKKSLATTANGALEIASPLVNHALALAL